MFASSRLAGWGSTPFAVGMKTIGASGPPARSMKRFITSGPRPPPPAAITAPLGGPAADPNEAAVRNRISERRASIVIGFQHCDMLAALTQIRHRHRSLTENFIPPYSAAPLLQGVRLARWPEN